jgi:hypothetical protein
VNVDERWAFLSILRGYTAAESPLTGDYDWMAKPVVAIPMFSPALHYVLKLTSQVKEQALHPLRNLDAPTPANCRILWLVTV